ncbi:YqaJ viral recombinase family protein [Bacillus sp. HC-Mk]
MAPEVNAKALAWGKQYENDARTLFEFTSGVNVIESPIIFSRHPHAVLHLGDAKRCLVLCQL